MSQPDPNTVDERTGALADDTAYASELEALRNKLLALGGKVEAAIANSVQAVIQRDSGLAVRVKQDDRDINLLEIDIDESCQRILSARRPDPADLRFVTTALKIVVDLERMGDLAVNIANRALELNEAPPLRPFIDLTRLAELGQKQLHLALDAFVSSDVSSAEQVLAEDDLLDALYSATFNDLVAIMVEDARNIRRAMSLMFIAKQLERVGDHSTNVAEMVVYMVRGTDIRHRRSRTDWK